MFATLMCFYNTKFYIPTGKNDEYLNVSYLVLMHEDVQNRQLYVMYILPQCMMRLFLVPKSDAYNETILNNM